MVKDIRKKLLKTILLIAIIVMIIIPKQEIAASNIMLGDINDDKIVDSRDMLYILRHIATKVNKKHPEWELKEEKLEAADVTKDEKVDAEDMLLVLRYIAASNSETIKNKHPEWTEFKKKETIKEIKEEETKPEQKQEEIMQETKQEQEEPKQQETKKQEEQTTKPEVKTIEVTGIKIDKTKLEIEEGKTEKIKATITPTNATNKEIKYSSSNTKIATVDSNGIVTAKNSGTTTITATSTNGKKSECLVNVIKTDLSKNDILVELENKTFIYNGKEQKPNIKIKKGNQLLELNKDYTLKYENNINSGTASVIISGNEKFKGTIKKEFKIEKKSITEPTINNKTLTYNGKEQNLKINNSSDYTVLNNKATNAGKYKTTISLKDNKNTKWNDGTTKDKTIEWYITQKSLNKSMVTLKDKKIVYTGKKITPEVSVKDGNTTLKNKKDYVVEYKDNIKAGKATVIIKGTGNYKGNITNNFEIIKEDIYDIILFFGQSNMVGSARNTVETRYNRGKYKYNGAKSVDEYSKLTGIDRNILNNNGEKINFVSIKQKANTAYEYKYLSNSFNEIDSTKQKNYGEKLVYKNGKLLDYNKTNKSYFSIYISNGTNIIPQFCKTYYEKTGHKVIAVFAAHGGMQIQAFLPQNDSRNNKYKFYIYESIKVKYKAAIDLAKKKNLKIGNKMYVVVQGEADVSNKTTTKEYKSIFKTVHNSLKKDLGIEKGAIIKTAYTTGGKTMRGLNAVNKAQNELIKENKDIILGSSFFYDRYVSTKNDYNNCNTKVTIGSNGKKLSYNQALERSRLIADPTITDKSTGKRNYIHFSSAALSQAGMEAANNLAKEVKE